MLIDLWLVDADLAKQVVLLPWLGDGVKPAEKRMLDDLLRVAEDGPQIAHGIAATSWMTDEVTGTDANVIDVIRAIAFKDVGVADAILSFPWIMDDLNPDELSFINRISRFMEEDPTLTLLKKVMDFWWVADDVTAPERSAIDNLVAISRIDAEAGETIWALPWVIDGITIDESRSLNGLRQLSRVDAAFAKEALDFSWVADGMTKWEKLAFEDLVSISSNNGEAGAAMLAFPWVTDGITGGDSSATSSLFSLMNEYPAFAEEVLDLWWVMDDMTQIESYALADLRDLAREDLALAQRVIAEPFMEPPFRQRDEYALSALVGMTRDGLRDREGMTQLERLTGTPWFGDGIDDLEAALLHAIVFSGKEFREALMKTHYVKSVPIVLPSSGEVELVVVRHTPFPADDHTFTSLEYGVGSVEGFIETPFPVSDVILLLTEPEIWDFGSGARFAASILKGVSAPYTSAVMAIQNSPSGPRRDHVYHEIAHYYQMKAWSSSWLSEGAAQFFETYALVGGSVDGLEGRLTHLDTFTSFEGSENIQQWITDRDRIQCGCGVGLCHYVLGERFMLGMHFALGQEGLLAALRDLNHLSSMTPGYLNEDTIYYAFSSNVPVGKEEAFKAAYRQYHGGPAVDTVPTGGPEYHSLMALYNSTNGDNWLNSENWGSSAPLGTWYGVTTDPEGRIRLLELNSNNLVGEIPPDLGNLTHLLRLRLNHNQLTGSIPPELGRLSNLRQVRLDGNNLSGQIPAEFVSLPELEQLLLGGNEFTGCFPLPPQDAPAEESLIGTNVSRIWNRPNTYGLPYC